ncbi:unnamed protein product [Spirodela intermedia]|uniref:Fucosyltransferase n=1 Tax=Spirodela intermedia TaxID=51605 RepID=A0A7I8JX63_SPIIN|nr:unnamed protein product [Spirodela intermedia]
MEEVEGSCRGDSGDHRKVAAAFVLEMIWKRALIIGCLTMSFLGIINLALVSRTDNKRGEDYFSGLLVAGFNRSSCRSRYESALYRKPSRYKPSARLVRKLRQYEDLHRRCGPHTASYNKVLRLLKPGGAAREAAETGCRYLVWTPTYGLGNRILSLASTFLYALLTDRVLLIDRGNDFSSLMCEPFPNTTWLLPLDFPVKNFNSFNQGHPLSYGRLVKNKTLRNDVLEDPFSGHTPSSFVYLHLTGGYTSEDAYFFCEPDQLVLREVPWLLVRSDEYFVPALFLNNIFDLELTLMFPEKEAVFHHLCRYLFHPSNEVWGMITRYYESYLATAEEIVGIQIRVFDKKRSPFDVVLRQVLDCTLTQKLLPGIDLSHPAAVADRRKTKAVLITSLYTGYLEHIRTMYWEHPAAGGLVVSVHQPSHEGWQNTGNKAHDMKAWAEMNLLGFADVIVTTARSTFGYIGQALGGVKPWILLRPQSATIPKPACVRDFSMEPCFHAAPHYFCRGEKGGDIGAVVPYVTRCKDVPNGLKLVDLGPSKV